MKTFIALISLLVSSSVFAEPHYVVKAEILNQTELLGSPTLVVESGIASAASADGSYSLSIIASPSGEGHAFLKTELEVDGELHSPSMMVDLGKESKITIGNTTLIVIVKKFNA